MVQTVNPTCGKISHLRFPFFRGHFEQIRGMSTSTSLNNMPVLTLPNVFSLGLYLLNPYYGGLPPFTISTHFPIAPTNCILVRIQCSHYLTICAIRGKAYLHFLF